MNVVLNYLYSQSSSKPLSASIIFLSWSLLMASARSMGSITIPSFLMSPLYFFWYLMYKSFFMTAGDILFLIFESRMPAWLNNLSTAAEDTGAEKTIFAQVRRRVCRLYRQNSVGSFIGSWESLNSWSSTSRVLTFDLLTGDSSSSSSSSSPGTRYRSSMGSPEF